MNMSYTGIGSRNTPSDILNIMTAIAKKLDQRGFVLRSGGAKGADSAFEAGATATEIYVPWKGFENSTSTFIVQPGKAFEIAKQFHPVWDKLSQGAKKLHSRNAHQVLGYNLDSPSKFVICWTPDGCINKATRKRTTGGTGMAIAIADHYGIPVFNLQRSDHYKRLSGLLQE